MALDDWPERDRRWAARYILCLAVKQDVSYEASEARQAELIAAVESAGLPAAELFGDPDEAAAADGADIRSSEPPPAPLLGGGRQDGIDAMGVAYLTVGVPAAILVPMVGGARVDVTVGTVALMAGIVIALFAGGAAWSAAAEGYPRRAMALGLTAVAAALFAASQVSWPNRADVLVAGLPSWIAVPAILAPGIVALVVARFVSNEPRQAEEYTDDQWFMRFRDVLRSRWVSADVIDEHVRSLRADLPDVSTATEEYGDPVALARRLANDDSAADRRRWTWKAAAFAVFAFLVLFGAITSLIGDGPSWGVLAPIAVVFLYAPTALKSWRSRPRKAGA
ncbi:putative protein OS=Tsukamurella paurometabola (strain ATCC 8368 / DSM / CCUG 35730 /CIP 100753 / JCM 10117 / KCTC 9821 / NBRC 16120 / NCIMB 702349/ NCTC 13040) OX=521096 GN=Tpau_0473 PE=4 SV=1 [Tsukamurella paurometabola]|uniref:Uncharacterized protein n=1 Tax=Tsukamurella paurometabola (strain ATCC 8368 / DSM 20162 / CCUG 35730 / CIP 100753 / JCM 10117 / KCTC 9821 / NBRC 16120 / NCIMB 702349 / NCTC 13040) TaxID=521096 RepID=D5US47_TSUPD|nr:hypothetical protein [Tsukamurella paurometabola]ADG77114.1 hypothetical protein Tpau_0473 [Tsukamurella paurometabola DSM 20162]SUP42833.1 Uncharacterised protein [Tsukamurella paurometabola]